MRTAVTGRNCGADPEGVCRNPFAARYVASMRLASRDANGHRRDLRPLAALLARGGRGGAIVGPHGSGKSTLLGQLADHIEASSSKVLRLRLRAHGDAAAIVMSIARAPRGSVVCVDGWERLGWMVAIALVAARLRRATLVVTSHRRGYLPTLVECRTSIALLEAIVADLPVHHLWFGQGIAQGDLAASFLAAGGDVRVALFMLYDVFERRVRGTGARR